MRKPLILALSLAAGLAVTACSQESQENAERTADSVGEDIGGAATTASDAIGDAADAVGNAADDSARAISGAADEAGAAVDEAGNKIEEGTERTRARIHQETAPDPKET